jgi:hypothetical protein
MQTYWILQSLINSLPTLHILRYALKNIKAWYSFAVVITFYHHILLTDNEQWHARDFRYLCGVLNVLWIFYFKHKLVYAESECSVYGEPMWLEEWVSSPYD